MAITKKSDLDKGSSSSDELFTSDVNNNGNNGNNGNNTKRNPTESAYSSFGAVNRMFSRGGGHAVSEFLERGKLSIEGNNSGNYDLKLFELKDSSLPHSTIAFSMRSRSSGISCIMLIIFGNTGSGSNTYKVRTNNGGEIEVDRVSSGALNESLCLIAKDEALRMGVGGGSDPEVIILGALDIIKGLTEVNESVIDSYLISAGQALETYMIENETGYRDVSFATSAINGTNELSSDVKLEVRVDLPFSGGVFDVSGLPIRAAANITFEVSSKSRQHKKREYDGYGASNSSTEVTSVVGYGEIKMSNTSNINQYSNNNDPDRYKRFKKYFNISYFNAPSMTDGSIFLAAASAASLSGSPYEIDLFRPVLGGVGPDIDLGALNYLAELPTESDNGIQYGEPLQFDSSASGNKDDVADFLRRISHDGLVINIEFTRCGGTSMACYNLDVLGSATASVAEKKISKTAIWESLIDLTDGRIKDNFSHSEPFLMASEPDRPSGFFINENGDKLPSSSIGLLEVVSEYHNSNPDRIYSWLQANMDPDMDPNESRKLITDIWSDMSRDSYKTTGVSVSRTFNPALLEAIAVSLNEIGIDLVMARQKGSSRWAGQTGGSVNDLIGGGFRNSFNSGKKSNGGGAFGRRSYVR